MSTSVSRICIKREDTRHIAFIHLCLTDQSRNDQVVCVLAVFHGRRCGIILFKLAQLSPRPSQSRGATSAKGCARYETDSDVDVTWT